MGKKKKPIRFSLQDNRKKDKVISELKEKKPMIKEESHVDIPKEKEYKSVEVNGKSFAPYNYIPMDENIRVNDPYKNGETEEGMEEGKLPSFRNQFKRNSGYVDFTMRALTPIAVNTGAEEGEFCKDVNGNYVIPGSTVKGFIRSNAEKLSFANPAINGLIENEVYHFRGFASASKKIREDYSKVMKSDRNEKRSLRIAKGVMAGYIYKTEDVDGDHYWIRPAKPFGVYDATFFRIHEADLYDEEDRGILDEDCYMYTTRIDKFYNDPKDHTSDETKLKNYNDELEQVKNDDYHPYRLTEPVWFEYFSKDNKVKHVGWDREKLMQKRKADGKNEWRDQFNQGFLVNSAYMRGKTSHYLVSTQKDKVGTELEISKEDWESYEDDYNRSCIQNKELIQNAEFYKLPDQYGIDNAKLFFFIQKDGKVVGFGPSPYFRIKYEHESTFGIPKTYQRETMDYVSAMFGYIDEDGKRNGSYKGRLSFMDAKADRSCTASHEEMVLNNPKPTAVQMYLDQTGKDKRTLSTYSDSDFKMRGYKIYWKRNGVAKWTPENDNENIVSHIETVESGVGFKARVYFDNLRDDELGLLLKSIRFSDKSDAKETHMIGKGKPYGYGKIEIQDVNLCLYDNATRFTSFGLGFVSEHRAEEKYREAFVKRIMNNEAVDSANLDYMNSTTIADYAKYVSLEICGQYTNPDDRVYMDLDGYGEMLPLPSMKSILGHW